MSEHKYSKLVIQELNRLGELAAERESESRLRKISTLLNRWKKHGISSSAALAEIYRLSGKSPLVWSEGADPGVHAAHAVASGYLTRKDFSEPAWRAIDILITLSEI